MKILGIIPARYGSTRFPGKPLVEIMGKSMILRVVEQAEKCSSLEEVIVATDDERIRDHVLSAGKKVIMTSTEHVSGTDRCLEALQICGIEADAVINIQGDEPFVDPSQIEELCKLIARENVEIATLAKEIYTPQILEDPNKVKVVFSKEGRAVYFSRHPVPYLKNFPREEWMAHHTFFKHLGLYAYRSKVLHEICQLSPSPLEMAESLEQLRWLEAGCAVFVATTDIETPAIDCPEDLVRLIEELSNDGMSR